MHLIVGLGNPGPQYDQTRHNVGFLVVDRLAIRHGLGSPRAQFQGQSLQGRLGGKPCLLLKPMTYMNRSGLAVAEAMRFYKITLANLLVVVDDCALEVGRLRLRRSGGAGGHNGLADITVAVGDETYARLRLGIDPPGRTPKDQYVLGRIAPSQRPPLETAMDLACDAVAAWVRDGIEPAMNQYNAST